MERSSGVVERLRRGRGALAGLALLAGLLAALSPAALAEAAEPLPVSGDLLTLDRCLRLAYENHPVLASARAALRKAEGALAESRSGKNATLSLTLTPSLQDSEQRHGASLGADQLLSDGGRTDAAIAAARAARDAAARDRDRVWQERAYAVREAYWQLLQADRDREVAEETVRLYEKHLERAKALFGVGKSPRSDVTAAEVDLGQSRLALIQARTASEQARRVLANALGLRDLTSGFRVEDPPDPVPPIPSREEALALAEVRRPDLAAARLRIDESGERLRYAAKGQNATLSAFGQYDYVTGSDMEDDDGWKVGLSLSWTLLDGGATAAQVEQARADRDSALASEASTRDTVALEVEKALLKIREAEENVRTLDLVVRQARENRDLATGRYEVGVGSPLEVSDAVDKYDQARRDAIKARYDLRIARADLDRAVGTAIPVPGGEETGEAGGGVPGASGTRKPQEEATR